MHVCVCGRTFGAGSGKAAKKGCIYRNQKMNSETVFLKETPSTVPNLVMRPSGAMMTVTSDRPLQSPERVRRPCACDPAGQSCRAAVGAAEFCMSAVMVAESAAPSAVPARGVKCGNGRA